MRHTRYTARTVDLVPGFKGETCDFSYRSADERTGDDLASWQALHDDIAERGIINPLVTYRGHVLIGMRRWEIAMHLGIEEVEAIEIDEDMGHWRLYDVRRLKRWLATIYADAGNTETVEGAG